MAAATAALRLFGGAPSHTQCVSNTGACILIPNHSPEPIGCSLAALLYPPHPTRPSQMTWCPLLPSPVGRTPISGSWRSPSQPTYPRPSHLAFCHRQPRTPTLLYPTHDPPPSSRRSTSRQRTHPFLSCALRHPPCHHGRQHRHPPRDQLFLRQVGGLLLRGDREAVRVRRRLWLRLHHD